MKVCSFLPAVTHILQEFGWGNQIVGATFECPGNYPKVVRSVLEDHHLSASEIDRFVSEKLQKGESLYSIDQPLLEKLQPDIIFTQDVCEVCQIDTIVTREAIKNLSVKPEIIPLIPRNLEEVLDSFLIIARSMKNEEKGREFISHYQKKLRHIESKLVEHNLKPRNVFFMEWMSPIYHSGHWIPDQIRAAGGQDLLSQAGEKSSAIEWKALQKYNPEILLIAPCGMDIHSTEKAYSELKALPGWSKLKAVQQNQVYALDSDWFTCPGPDLIKGIELIAALIHPDHFSLPVNASAHFKRLENGCM